MGLAGEVYQCNQAWPLMGISGCMGSDRCRQTGRDEDVRHAIQYSKRRLKNGNSDATAFGL